MGNNGGYLPAGEVDAGQRLLIIVPGAWEEGSVGDLFFIQLSPAPPLQGVTFRRIGIEDQRFRFFPRSGNP